MTDDALPTAEEAAVTDDALPTAEEAAVTERSEVIGTGARVARRGGPAWWVIAVQECRDLWLGGRGTLLLFAFSVLLSAMTYLTATNQVLNFLEQREAAGLIVQIAVAVGSLVTVVVSADAISGDRERGTLENLLHAPVQRRDIVVGKLIAALSLWSAAFLVSVPYVWALARGVFLVTPALLIGALVGTLLSVMLAAVGLLISGACNSNKVSLSISLFLLLALFAPTQLPASLLRGWFGDLLVRLNPIGAGLRYINLVLVSGHDWTAELSYLAAPLVGAVAAGTALIVASSRIVRLTAGVNGA